MQFFSKTDTISWNEFLQQKALELKLTNCQTRVFSIRFGKENWLSRIEDIWQLSDVNSYESFVKHSTHIYQTIKPYCPEISKGAGNFSVVRDWLLSEYNKRSPESTITKENLSVRSAIEQECQQAILEPGALIRIKAPSKMGKSSLLNRILAFSSEQEYRTVHINLLKIETSKFDSLSQFLRWFCIYISDALKLDLDLNEYWSEDRGSKTSCTRYLEAILTDLEQPLVLGLDEVDRLLNYPDISQDFFYLLRSWHEEANNKELWENLRMVVVYSTEDFGSLDINQSPFNVGLPIHLQFLDFPEVKLLIDSYQLTLSELEIEQLITILGGHPYLVDLTLSCMAKNPELSLNELLQKGTTDAGIYHSYLLQHLINLKSSQVLENSFLKILNSSQPIAIDTLVAYQLHRMGLIKWSTQGNTVMPSCKLYQQYFKSRISN